jgi:predicted CoA-binding protein
VQEEAMRELLVRTRSIAVLGAKADPAEDAQRVAAYLKRAGYRILPVNPKHARVLDEPCVPTLAALASAPDLIDVFRAAQHLPGHVDEIPSWASATTPRRRVSRRRASPWCRTAA